MPACIEVAVYQEEGLEIAAAKNVAQAYAGLSVDIAPRFVTLRSNLHSPAHLKNIWLAALTNETFFEAGQSFRAKAEAALAA